jgi:hypothetical protein
MYGKMSREWEPVWDDALSEQSCDRILLPLLQTIAASNICKLFPDNSDTSWWGSARCTDRVREVFGNPFCQDFLPLPANLQARQAPIHQIAKDIYRSNAFHLMPILGDALAEIWGIEGSLPAHCRIPGSHCKGCWALDFVLDVCQNRAKRS